MSELPKNLKYTKDHEWAKLSGKTATVGITEFAAHALGDIVYVELPKVGAKVKAGATFGVVESTKAVSDLFSPATGTVTKVNDAIADAPETLNQDPYEKGWLIQIDLADVKELDPLMDAAAYEQHAKASAH